MTHSHVNWQITVLHLPGPFLRTSPEHPPLARCHGYHHITTTTITTILFLDVLYLQHVHSMCDIFAKHCWKFIPQWKDPGEWNGNALWYSCLENSMDRGVWWATVHGVARVGHDLVTKPPLPWAGKSQLFSSWNPLIAYILNIFSGLGFLTWLWWYILVLYFKIKLILKLNILSGGRNQLVNYNFITNMGIPMKSKNPDSMFLRV